MKISNPFHKEASLRNPFKANIRFVNIFKPDRSLTEVSYGFFVLAIFFLPFDSFPIFPVSSTYRPVSVLCLLVCFMVNALSGKIRKVDLAIATIAVLMGAHAVFGAVWYFQEYGHLTKTIITLILFFVIISSLNSFLLKLINDKGIDWTLSFLTRIMAVSMTFLCFIGTIQFLSSLGLFPAPISKQITLLFTYRVNQAGRLQLVSGEPSMLVRNLMTIIPFLYLYYYGKYKKIFLGAIAFFLILSGSTYGYMVIVFFTGFHLVFFHLTRRNIRRVLVYGLLFVGVMSFAYFNYLPDYTKRKIDRVAEFASDPQNLIAIAEADGSIFQRVMNPYIGFISGEYSNYMGIGLDNFRYIYPEYVLEHFPFAVKHGSIMDVIKGEDYITPKSFYARIFTELGVIPFLLYIGYLLYLYLRIRKLKKHNKLYNFASICFTLIIVFMISWDSLIYFNLLFLAVLITLILKFHKTEAVESHPAT